MIALSRQTASHAALLAARSVTLAGLAGFWICLSIVLFLRSEGVDWAARLAAPLFLLAAWGCVSLLVLCAAVFPGASTGLDGAIGLACVAPAVTALVGAVPTVASFSAIFFYVSAGVLPVVCGIFLAKSTLATGPSEGGGDARPEI